MALNMPLTFLMRTSLSLPALLITAAASSAHAFTVNCGQRQVNYSSGAMMISAAGTIHYPTGTVMINSAGTVFFSSGSVFRSTEDVIYHPSGGILKTADGLASYAVGTPARNSSGELLNLDGSPAAQPIRMTVALSSQYNAVVNVAPNVKTSDISIELPAEAGQTVKIFITPTGVECPDLTADQEVTINHRSARVSMKVRPGFSPDRVREAVQQALDKIPESIATPAPSR